MAKRGKNAKNTRKRTPAKSTKSGLTSPVVARAKTAIPPTALMIAAGACAVGALAFILLSGVEGQRRRALIREKALQAGRGVSETLSKGGRDVRQRLESVATQATKRLRGERMANGVSERRLSDQPMNL